MQLGVLSVESGASLRESIGISTLPNVQRQELSARMTACLHVLLGSRIVSPVLEASRV